MGIEQNKHGFTIVELLIVIVVIGILAAITIVAYNGIQDRANSTTVRSDLANTAKKMDLYKVDSPSGSYPGASQLGAAGLKFTPGAYKVRNNLYYCISTDGQHYAFGAVAKGDTEYYLADGKINEVSAGSVGSALTCPQAQNTTSAWAHSVGYDSSGGNGWNEAWTGNSGL